MKRLLLALLLVLPTLQAEAHRFAPSLLRLFEVADNEYQVIWKTPAQRVSEVPLLPHFPPECDGAVDAPGSLEGTGVVSSWRLVCSSSLVGKTVSFTGLAENSASVLLSLETRDGLFYQSLLSLSAKANVPLIMLANFDQSYNIRKRNNPPD